MADANQYIADEVQPDLLKMEYSIKPVSYTHLDVYKRQGKMYQKK